jgi:hypothetical protein
MVFAAHRIAMFSGSQLKDNGFPIVIVRCELFLKIVRTRREWHPNGLAEEQSEEAGWIENEIVEQISATGPANPNPSNNESRLLQRDEFFWE